MALEDRLRRALRPDLELQRKLAEELGVAVPWSFSTTQDPATGLIDSVLLLPESGDGGVIIQPVRNEAGRLTGGTIKPF
jgi:hypothetical protein